MQPSITLEPLTSFRPEFNVRQDLKSFVAPHPPRTTAPLPTVRRGPLKTYQKIPRSPAIVNMVRNGMGASTRITDIVRAVTGEGDAVRASSFAFGPTRRYLGTATIQSSLPQASRPCGCEASLFLSTSCRSLGRHFSPPSSSSLSFSSFSRVSGSFKMKNGGSEL